MKILFITDYLPYPPISGGSLRVYNLVRSIARENEVSLVAPLRTAEDMDSVAHLKEFCGRVETAPLNRQHPFAHVPGLVQFALKGRPFELKFLYSREMGNKVKELAGSERFDIVQIEHSWMAFYRDVFQTRGHEHFILDFHNVASQQYDRVSRITSGRVAKMRASIFSRQMSAWESRYAEKFDRCVVVSEPDRRLLLEQNPALKTVLVPNGVDTQLYQLLPPKSSKPGLLFIGLMSYAPCADAALYFCNEILPIVRRAVPEVQVWLVGADPPPEVLGLNGDGVHVTGRVPDVVPYYRDCTVSIVPLRAGGGTRLKILEAMALGRPVVSTSVGSEGLDVVDGKHLLTANDPDEFARCTVRLLTDTALRERLTVDARQLVETRYDWNSISRQLTQVYAELVQ